jgi:alpha-glucosidase
LYEDAGDGYDYTQGMSCLKTFSVNGNSNQLIIDQKNEGNYNAGYSTAKIVIHGLPFTPKSITIDGTIVKCETQSSDTTDIFTFIASNQLFEHIEILK